MKTQFELIEHCKNASSWKYVYGMKGAVLTQEKYNGLKKQYGSMVWDSDITKVGQICCDCSGLISSCTGILRGSTNQMQNATESATLEELKANWQNYVGWGIWMQGHIGVVSDTEGYYYAMDGSARNWKHYPLNKNAWEKVIKLCDIDYITKVETKGDFTGMTDLQKELFVKNVLYVGLLDRQADESGLKHWVSLMDDNMSLADLTDRFMETEEARKRCVTVAYERLLNREPDESGFDHWVEWLKGEKNADDLYNAIKNSEEYKKKHS